MNIIDSSGQFTGTPGYARNFTPRTAPGFTDTSLVHILPPSNPLEARDVDTDGVSATDAMCRKSQQEQYQSNGFPRLSAQPGNMIALRYEENGHVTLPQNQKGKPPNRGTVYVYGTTQPKPTENFLDVFKQWDAAGTGGDKRGKLLATQNFDDGRCYQVNSGAISKARQSQYPHSPDKTMGTDLWCQTDIKIPDDAPAGKPYTLYWVWDWPTEPNVDPAIPKGKAEIYTTCMDIDVKSASKERSIGARAAQAQNLNSMAIPSLVSSLANPSAAAPASSQAAASSAPQNNAATASQPASGAASAVTPVAAAVQQPSQVAAEPSQAASASSMPANAPSSLASAESIILSVLGSQVISDIAAQVHTQAPVTVTVTEQQAPGGCPTASANMPASPPAASSAAANPAAANTAAAVPAAATSAAAVPAAANSASVNPVAANSGAQNSAAQPPATSTVTSGTSTIYQSATQTATSTLILNPTAGNSEEPSAMPSSLQMTSPLMGPTSAAEVPAASASPAASSASNAPALPEASQPSGSAGASPALPTLAGTATPVASPAANTAGSSPSASGAATPNSSTGSSGTTAAKRCDAGTCRKSKKSQIFS